MASVRRLSIFYPVASKQNLLKTTSLVEPYRRIYSSYSVKHGHSPILNQIFRIEQNCTENEIISMQ
jgi:hypothetical protein